MSRTLPRLLTRAELAKRTGVSERTVDRLRLAGKLPCVRVGRAVRFDPVEVDAALKDQRGEVA
ncbi:helix-turn-helix domain-containing protein [Sinomonas albida]|uniref:helix-turn-helix transcriptional regulator n=1 Tax=Sinomonas albida TaxID=369942 RepID=UPI0030189061